MNSNKITTLKEAISKKVGYTANIDNTLRIKKEINALDDKIKIVDGFFVKSGEEPYFVGKVENLGKSLGLKVETDSISDGSLVKDGFKVFNVVIKYEGSWNNVISFLNNLESMPYAVIVNGISINLPEGDKLWSGTAEISVYKAKE